MHPLEESNLQGRLSTCHLVSFADGAFLRRADGFRAEADDSGFFETVSIYDLDSLDASFRARHEDFMRRAPKGFGYWIWKPQCVLQLLETLDDGALVVYLDVGFEINPAGRGRFNEYLQLVLESDHGMLSFSNTHTEYRWTKMDLAWRLGLSSGSKHLLTTQLAAGFFILQNTQRNRDLVITWRDLAVEANYHYSNDAPSKIPNHAEFVGHRHDASIFSLLRKLHGTEVTHYEVQTYDTHFLGTRDRLPLWASRKGRE